MCLNLFILISGLIFIWGTSVLERGGTVLISKQEIFNDVVGLTNTTFLFLARTDEPHPYIHTQSQIALPKNVLKRCIECYQTNRLENTVKLWNSLSIHFCRCILNKKLELFGKIYILSEDGRGRGDAESKASRLKCKFDYIFLTLQQTNQVFFATPSMCVCCVCYVALLGVSGKLYKCDHIPVDVSHLILF